MEFVRRIFQRPDDVSGDQLGPKGNLVELLRRRKLAREEEARRRNERELVRLTAQEKERSEADQRRRITAERLAQEKAKARLLMDQTPTRRVMEDFANLLRSENPNVFQFPRVEGGTDWAPDTPGRYTLNLSWDRKTHWHRFTDRRRRSYKSLQSVKLALATMDAEGVLTIAGATSQILGVNATQEQIETALSQAYLRPMRVSYRKDYTYTPRSSGSSSNGPINMSAGSGGMSMGGGR